MLRELKRAGAGGHHDVLLRDTRTGNVLSQRTLAHVPSPRISFSPDGTRLKIDDGGAGARGDWRFARGRGVISPDGDTLLQADAAGTIGLRDLSPDLRSLAQWERQLARSPFPAVAAPRAAAPPLASRSTP